MIPREKTLFTEQARGNKEGSEVYCLGFQMITFILSLWADGGNGEFSEV